ncbi:bacillithiol system redox-active protein YtxJ [Niabella aquatica]
MSWIILDREAQLDEINKKSFSKPQLIFKHSTRCSISSVIKNRLYKGTLPENIDFYYLDLIANRDISNAIAEKYEVAHESPQALLIKDGRCIFNESHSAIYMDEIIENSL